MILFRLAFLFFVTFVVPVCGMESTPSNEQSVIGKNYEQKNKDLEKKLAGFAMDYFAVKQENEKLHEQNRLSHSQVLQLSEKFKSLASVIESERAEREKLLSENKLLFQCQAALVFELEEKERIFSLEIQQFEKKIRMMAFKFLLAKLWPNEKVSNPLVGSSGNTNISEKESKASFINKKTVIVSIFILLAAAVYACYKNHVEMPEFLKAYKAT